MKLGQGIILRSIGGSEFTQGTLDHYPRGLHAPRPVIPSSQSQRCCEFDHILSYLRLLPFTVEREPPFVGDVWFELHMLRWEYMGPIGQAIETSIRLVAYNPIVHYFFSTIGDIEGRFDNIGRHGFGFEPAWLNLRFEVIFNRFDPLVDVPLRLREGHHVRPATSLQLPNGRVLIPSGHPSVQWRALTPAGIG